MIEVISILVDIFFIYLALGLLFALWFVFAGASRLDKGVSQAPWHFRLMILPGSILLWLPLLVKLIRQKT